jgi:hypothetical protein
MGVGTALQRLGRFIEECEQTEAVDGVALAGGVDRSADGDLAADVEVTLSGAVPAGESTRLCATSVNADGTVRLGFETTGAVVPQTDDVAVEPAGATVDPGGPVCLTLSVSAAASRGGASGGDPARTDTREGTAERPEEDGEGKTEGSDRDLPPFKNPQLLGEVYDACDTFAEMADALDMDVTAETVRRYMIDFGIHEPSSYDTGAGDGSDEAPEVDEAPEIDEAQEADEAPEIDEAPEADDVEGTPPVLSDGIGLPDDITVETLIETVERSNTIYEVKRDLGVGREDALEMLRECNLLDLVMCRLATEAERDITREDVVERLRTASRAG